MARVTIPAKDRFLRSIRVDARTGCWVWQLGLDPDGYGHIRLGSRTDGTRRRMLAHRFAYQEFVAPLSGDLTIDHLCRNRRCVNPAHLEQVSAQENTKRGARATADHCKRGHPFSGRNLLILKNGQRRCRECRNACARDYQRRTGHAASKAYRERQRNRTR